MHTDAFWNILFTTYRSLAEISEVFATLAPGAPLPRTQVRFAKQIGSADEHPMGLGRLHDGEDSRTNSEVW